MVILMTDQSTSTVHNGHFVPDMSNTRDVYSDVSQSTRVGVTSAVSVIQDVLTPAEWEELAEFMYARLESLHDEFRTREGLEYWREWVNSNAAKEISASIPEKLRSYVECRLRQYQSTSVGNARDFRRSGGNPNSPCTKPPFEMEQDDSRLPSKQTSPAEVLEASPTDSSTKVSAESAQMLPETFKLEEEFWDGWGCVPNVLLRSSVFAATRVSSRTLRDRKVASLSNVVIVVTGPQLTQPDLDVWMEAVYLARHGDAVQINRRALLERLGRTTGSSDREWLTKSLARLSKCRIDVSVRRQPRFSGCLLQSLKIHRQTKRVSDAKGPEIELSLDPSMVNLFRDGWTMLKFSARTELRGDPLANWVLGFYRSHRDAYDLKVETLHRLSGIGGGLAAFRQRLERSLATLVSGDHLGTAVITNDKVSVIRNVMLSNSELHAKEKERAQRLRHVANRSQRHRPRVGLQKQHIRLMVWRHIIRWCRLLQSTFRPLARQGWARIRDPKGSDPRDCGTHRHD